MTDELTDNEWNVIQNIAKSMGIPNDRQRDLPWLSRNLGIAFKDKTHPDLVRANELIRKGMRANETYH